MKREYPCPACGEVVIDPKPGEREWRAPLWCSHGHMVLDGNPRFSDDFWPLGHGAEGKFWRAEKPDLLMYAPHANQAVVGVLALLKDTFHSGLLLRQDRRNRVTVSLTHDNGLPYVTKSDELASMLPNAVVADAAYHLRMLVDMLETLPSLDERLGWMREKMNLIADSENQRTAMLARFADTNRPPEDPP